MTRLRRICSVVSRRRFALVLLVIATAVVLLNAVMIAGIANCVSGTQDFTCAFAKFIFI